MPSAEFLQNDAFLTTELLKLAVELAGIGVLKVDTRTQSVELSATMKEMLGIPVGEPVDYAGFLAVLHPDDRENTRQALAAALDAEDGYCDVAFRVVPPAGETRWFAARGRTYFEGEGTAGAARLFIGAIRDVTVAKAAEATAQAALEQQQMLLHEVNHRVKNSLQLVSSLLRLQARRIPDATARQQLEDATTRISTIAHIHQRLYRDQDFQLINFGAFLSELCADLQGASPQCSITVHAPDFRVKTDRAIPMALVVNELVTNAFKYAYPTETGGKVTVDVALADSGEILLTVQDQGVGLPEGFTVAGGKNLGMILISGLLAQLSGKIEVRESGPGACFSVTIPPEDSKKAG